MRFEFSAGGIVYRHDPSTSSGQERVLILVAQHSQHHGWVFPKGLIDKKKPRTKNQELRTIKETKEEAALREVREETGVYGKIIKALPPVTYWYKFDNEKIKKTVYYFLMEYASGDIKDHDFEMENVEWLLINEVQARLTYKSDKEVWTQARKLLVSS